MEARSLLKLYGIRFDILVTGQVGIGPGERSIDRWAWRKYIVTTVA